MRRVAPAYGGRLALSMVRLKFPMNVMPVFTDGKSLVTLYEFVDYEDGAYRFRWLRDSGDGDAIVRTTGSEDNNLVILSVKSKVLAGRPFPGPTPCVAPVDDGFLLYSKCTPAPGPDPVITPVWIKRVKLRRPKILGGKDLSLISFRSTRLRDVIESTGFMYLVHLGGTTFALARDPIPYRRLYLKLRRLKRTNHFYLPISRTAASLLGLRNARVKAYDLLRDALGRFYVRFILG